ncbi:fibroblast growth factor receptor 3-like isoform X2 [Haliotis rufescens]|uniref:fibroblast growth factor receptor 3-like isoform X2 n=1 Tax=Haliotis rufescens TaxID=6454 RepID=UPI00201F18B2|nr:fibroblast growth factor receptor 3-like isoform X2 [Haliotis rufescens]
MFLSVIKMHPDLLLGMLMVSSGVLLLVEGDPTVRINKTNGTLLVASAGKSVKLDCVVTGINTAKSIQLGWQFVVDGSISPISLNSTGGYSITEVSQSANRRVIGLRMSAVTYDHEGYYYCHLRTTQDSYTDYVELRVEGAPTINLTETTSPGELASTLQNALNIMCVVRSRPQAEIKWFKDGTELYSSPFGYTITTTEPLLGIDAGSTLSVFTLTRDQLGTYVCQAKNTRGQARAEWRVTANPLLILLNPSINGSRVYLGDELNIQCQGRNLGNASKITWSFSSNGAAWTTLTGGNIITWPDTSGAVNSEWSVIFSHYSNQGIYRCSWKTLSQSVFVRVVGPPVVTLSTTSVTALLGDAVTLTCRVNANPVPNVLGWYYNNMDIRNSTKYTVYRTYIRGDLYSQTTLTINPVEVSDYGSKYRCVADNDEGSDSVNVTLRDVNECVTGEATCQWDQNENCVDTLGSYECHCATGFDRRGGVCTDSATRPPASSNTGVDNNVAIGLGVGITVIAIAIIVVIVVIVCRRRGNRERELIDVPKPKPPPTSGFYNSAYSVNDDEAHIYTELSPTGDEFPRSRLRFLNSLGEGKFGRVVMAEALSINSTGKWEEVAVKMVKETATDAMKEDFYHELVIVRKLPTHVNVVAYLGCVTASDPALMIMEYVNGGDLLTYLRKRRPAKASEQTSSVEALTPKDMLSFALQIARGMAHIAAQKIIHRDVHCQYCFVGYFPHRLYTEMCIVNTVLLGIFRTDYTPRCVLSRLFCCIFRTDYTPRCALSILFCWLFSAQIIHRDVHCQYCFVGYFPHRLYTEMCIVNTVLLGIFRTDYTPRCVLSRLFCCIFRTDYTPRCALSILFCCIFRTDYTPRCVLSILFCWVFSAQIIHRDVYCQDCFVLFSAQILHRDVYCQYCFFGYFPHRLYTEMCIVMTVLLGIFRTDFTPRCVLSILFCWLFSAQIIHRDVYCHDCFVGYFPHRFYTEMCIVNTVLLGIFRTDYTPRCVLS